MATPDQPDTPPQIQADGQATMETKILAFVDYLDREAIPTLNGNEATSDIGLLLHATRQTLVAAVALKMRAEGRAVEK